MMLFEVGPKIKQYRKDMNITQDQLAKQAGISRVTLGKLERGEVGSVSIKVLDYILQTLGYELEFKSKHGFGLPTLDQYV